MPMNAQLISGWKTRLLQKKIQWYIIAEAFKLFRKPILAISEMIRMRDLYMMTQGSTIVTKHVKSGNQSYWNADYCGYPSDNFNILIRSEFLRNAKIKLNRYHNLPKIQTLIWGITNRCPLSCQHCYEWDNIAQNDQLSLDELKKILAIFKTNGIRHIQFSGGEPLFRFNDLVELIREASPEMDCWLLTSGFGLTKEKAHVLKIAGLKGVNISLDHWDEKLHNSFRNNEKSYEMVMSAVNNCLSESMMVSLSLCATREFVTETNLMKYATLARNTGVHFLRILEHRAAGKFARQK